jgi:hypothetical protein
MNAGRRGPDIVVPKIKSKQQKRQGTFEKVEQNAAFCRPRSCFFQQHSIQLLET